MSINSTIIAFDFGTRAIGVALGNIELGSAKPLTAISVHSGVIDWPSIAELIDEWRPQQLLVGYPAVGSDMQSTIIPQLDEFIDQLIHRFHLPVERVDEHLTSAEAEEILRERRKRGIKKHRIQKTDVDEIAAMLILETWLHEQGACSE